MRCLTCGFPLSPNRTTCPRCGTVYGSGARPTPEPGAFAPAASHVPNGAEMPPTSWDTHAPQAPHAPSSWNPSQAQHYGEPGSPSPVEQLPFPSSTHNFSPSRGEPPMGATPPMSGPQDASWQTGFSPADARYNSHAPDSIQPGQVQQPYFRPVPQGGHRAPGRQPHATRVGLTAASLCVIVGALLLLVVSVMAQSLPPNPGPVTTGEQKTPTSQPQQTSTPAATQSPTPAPTTENFPGKMYIDNGRMASQVDEATGQVIQYATQFNTREKIYVTFTVNSGEQGGAICINWFVNNAHAANYELAIRANASYDSFSYALLHQAGEAYVEIAWASSTACTDKLLAQRVTFTVT